MSGPKVAIVVLVLLAVVFAGGVGFGVSRDDRSARLDEWPLASSLGDRLVHKERLPPEDLTSDCLDVRTSTFTFPAAGPHRGRCEAKVRAADVRLRTFRLRRKPGSASGVKVHWRPNEDKDRPFWRPKE